MSNVEGKHVFILVLMGVAGCGKSTVGKQVAQLLRWPFFDGDDFHSEENIQKMRSGIPLSTADRIPWLQAIHSHIKSSVKKDQNAVYACSALKQAYRDILCDSLCNVKFVYLKGSYDGLFQRLKQRTHFAGPALLPSQFQDLDEPHDAMIVDCEQNLCDIVAEIAAFVGQGEFVSISKN